MHVLHYCSMSKMLNASYIVTWTKATLSEGEVTPESNKVVVTFQKQHLNYGYNYHPRQKKIINTNFMGTQKGLNSTELELATVQGNRDINQNLPTFISKGNLLGPSVIPGEFMECGVLWRIRRSAWNFAELSNFWEVQWNRPTSMALGYF